jgi:antitoxin VapB
VVERWKPMSLNIKDEETHELVRELAALKGTTLTSAVKIAVKTEIDREKARQGTSQLQSRKKRSEVLQAFAREFVCRVKEPIDIHSWDIDKLLYDENGLPK